MGSTSRPFTLPSAFMSAVALAGREENVHKWIDVQAIYFTVTVDIAAKHLIGPHVDPGYAVCVAVSDTWDATLIEVWWWHEVRIAGVNGRAAGQQGVGLGRAAVVGRGRASGR